MSGSYGKTRRSLPNLTEAQERAVWRALAAAWKAVGERVLASCPAGTTKAAAMDAWRRTLLHEATGLTSLREVPRAGEAYAALMARLEQEAGRDIRWQVQRAGAAARPAVWRLRELLARLGITERYAAAVAARVLGLDGAVDFDRLESGQAARLVRFFEATGERIAAAAGRE